MAKIVIVYEKQLRKHDKRYEVLTPIDMSYIRWFKISEALARRGHQVDIATNEFKWWKNKLPIIMGQNLRRIPLSKIKWSNYDVVKTLFHAGLDTLEAYGGIKHPFIISKLGSVVGSKDMEGIYFYGKMRKWLYSIQRKISKTSKYVTLLSEPAKELWNMCFGIKHNILLVPGGVDRYISPPSQDPYPKENKIRCLFAGNVYNRYSQPEANVALVDKLNKLGSFLASLGVRLYMLGPGDVRQLNKRHVTYLGPVSYEKTWDYFYFAHIGIAILPGKFLHNNESSKIYHYLRVGLPVVIESGFPNENIITESKLGFIVENGNLGLMAQKIVEAAHKDWDRDYAIKYILDNHTWEKRAEIYDKIIKEQFQK
jgi:glycosyltransferase involved in cell wall biosynthesis